MEMEMVRNLVNSFKQFAAVNYNDTASRVINGTCDEGKYAHTGGRSCAYKHLLDWIASEVEPKIFGTNGTVTTATADLTGTNSSMNPTTVTESIPLDGGN